MRVAHVLNEIRHSGAETMLASAAPYMLAEGGGIIIATEPKRGDYAPVLQAAGYGIVHIPFAQSLRFYRSLARTLRRERIEVLHIHTEGKALWLSLLAFVIRMPSVRTIHNEFNFSGLLRFRRIITRWIAHLMGTTHVSCSPSVQRNERARFHLPTLLINNWMNPQAIPAPSTEGKREARTRLGIPHDAFIAISIANEAPAKNLAALFNGVLTAAAKGLPIALYHCGAIGPELKQLAATDPDAVIPVGTVDVSDYLAAADVFLSTSFNEGGQISLLEAAASGTCCITTKVGIAEALQNYSGVTYIAPGADDLMHSLFEFAKKPPERRDLLGAGLAKNVRDYFIPERGVAEYMKIYKNS